MSQPEATNGLTSFVANYSADVSSTLADYIGPANPLLTYTSGNYEAAAGYIDPFGNPGGFSVTGVDTTFGLNGGQSRPIVLAVYGYQVAVPEPATWAMMLMGLFGLGALLRSARRKQSGAIAAA